MKKISVIMPCFNESRTVGYTIKSVLSQTYDNIELICIDDCSDDNTYEVLEKYAEQYSMVKAYRNEENQGLGFSRNIGVTHSSGEMIAFLDADDYLEVDFLEELSAALVDNDADFAQCRVRYITNTGSHLYGSPAGILEGEQCKCRIDVADGLPWISPQSWNKLFKRELLEDNGYKNIYYEDAEILPKLLDSCKRIVTIAPALYNYNKKFSTITGIGKISPDRLPVFFTSLLRSLEPYCDDEFVALQHKWGMGAPRAPLANLNNFLKRLVSTRRSYQADELEAINDELVKFSVTLLPVLPEERRQDFFNCLLAFSDNMKFDNSLASIGKKHNLSPRGKQHRIRGLSLRIFERSMRILDPLLPKKQDLWVFSSWGRYRTHTMDNPRAIFEAVKDDRNITKVVLLNGDPERIKSTDSNSNVKFYPLHSFKGLFSLLLAGRLYTGYSLHNLFGYKRIAKSSSRNIIQLWHGIPIKKVGLEVASDQEPWWPSEVTRYHSLFASSDIDKATMVASFAPRFPDKVHLTGLPRHDLLIMQESKLPSDYRTHLGLIRSRLDGRKLVLFAPTWRDKGEKPCAFDLEEFKALSATMKECNAVLGVRLHPNMMKESQHSSFVSDNVVYFNDIPDVNMLLREAAVLVTDYSSLYLDFMKLERPVLLYTPDIDRYGLARGLNYKASEFLPHKYHIDSFQKLLERLKASLEGGYEISSAYLDVLSNFHHYNADDLNSRRVLQCLEEHTH